jgi:hypothetical protein
MKSVSSVWSASQIQNSSLGAFFRHGCDTPQRRQTFLLLFIYWVLTPPAPVRSTSPHQALVRIFILLYNYIHPPRPNRVSNLHQSCTFIHTVVPTALRRMQKPHPSAECRNSLNRIPQLPPSKHGGSIFCIRFRIF